MPITIAMLTLSEAATIDPAALAHTLAQDWPALPPATELRLADIVLSFSLGELQVYIGHMPVPLPWDDALAEACGTSIMWPGSAEVLQSDAMHLIVTVAGEAPALERSSVLTQVIASAIGVLPSASGVYWCGGDQVFFAPMFRELAQNLVPMGPAMLLWVNFRIGQAEDGRTMGFTRGMHALDLMDIETDNASDSTSELRNRFETLAAYLAENGLVIRDGDSVGASAAEKIQVVFSPSKYGSEGQVMRLEFADKAKPFWKVW